jgi:hypothetical protein
MKMQNDKYRTRDDQSSNEQVFIPKADGILLDPLNKLTSAKRMKSEKLIACFFH